MDNLLPHNHKCLAPLLFHGCPFQINQKISGKKSEPFVTASISPYRGETFSAKYDYSPLILKKIQSGLFTNIKT